MCYMEQLHWLKSWVLKRTGITYISNILMQLQTLFHPIHADTDTDTDTDNSLF